VGVIALQPLSPLPDASSLATHPARERPTPVLSEGPVLWLQVRQSKRDRLCDDRDRAWGRGQQAEPSSLKPRPSNSLRF